MTDTQFPAPEPGDPEEVVSALDTARVLLAGGEAQEAVRWIRKAAGAAEQGGNDMRALALARAAADLTSARPEAPAMPPPGAPPSIAGRTLRRPLRFSQSPSAGGPARPTQPPRSGAPRPATSVAPVAPSARAPEAPEAGTAQPGNAEPELDDSDVVGGEGPASPLADEPERQTRADATPDASPATAAKTASKVAAGPTPSGNGRADLANALNVSIKPSSRDERLFMMRMLKPGEQPPAGYRPALVIMVDSDEDEGV